MAAHVAICLDADSLHPHATCAHARRLWTLTTPLFTATHLTDRARLSRSRCHGFCASHSCHTCALLLLLPWLLLECSYHHKGTLPLRARHQGVQLLQWPTPALTEQPAQPDGLKQTARATLGAAETTSFLSPRVLLGRWVLGTAPPRGELPDYRAKKIHRILGVPE